jgi:hypothetical protein
VDAVFERLDGLYLGLSLLVVLIPGPSQRWLGGAGLGLLLLAAASDRAAGSAAGTSFATINEVLALLGVLLIAVATWRGFTRRARDTAPPEPATSRRAAFPDSWLLIGLLLLAAAPHLLLFSLGIALVLVAMIRAALRTPGPRWWVIPVLGGAGFLGVAMVLLLTILGPTGGGMQALAEGPFSPAAERLVVLLLASGSLLLSGIPPLHRFPWGQDAAPLAGSVVARIVVPALGGGLLDWHALVMLLLALAAIAAALGRRWPAALIATGLFTAWSGLPAGLLPGLVLVLFGWLASQAARGRLGGVRLLPARWSGVPALLPAVVALPALEAGLRSQVTLSVLLVAGLMAGLLAAAWRRPAPMEPTLY